MLARRHHSRRPLLTVATLAVFAVLLTGCFPSHPQSTFDAAGPVAREQLGLFQIIFWAAVFVFVVVEGALIVAVLRFRRKRNGRLPKQTHGNTPLEVTLTFIPVVVLAVVMVPTVTTIFSQARDAAPGALDVNVVAHQWWFEFVYPDQGITTANELHIPVDRPVQVSLESDDVIHSFWIPKLAGKTDIIPGNVNSMRFEADEVGRYYGQCAEFCGTAHAQMRFFVIAESQQDFQAWVENQQAPPAASMTREFGVKGCAVCHTVNGPDQEGTQGRRMKGFLEGQPVFAAPNLTHFASRETFAGGIVGRTDENLRAWIRNPGDIKPGNRMQELAGAYHNPSQALSTEDVTALVDYLQSLK